MKQELNKKINYWKNQRIGMKVTQIKKIRKKRKIKKKDWIEAKIKRKKIKRVKITKKIKKIKRTKKTKKMTLRKINLKKKKKNSILINMSTGTIEIMIDITIDVTKIQTEDIMIMETVTEMTEEIEIIKETDTMIGIGEITEIINSFHYI